MGACAAAAGAIWRCPQGAADFKLFVGPRAVLGHRGCSRRSE